MGFVALNPTYIWPVLLRKAKPNNGRFWNRAPKVSFLIRLDEFQAKAALNTDTCNLALIERNKNRIKIKSLYMRIFTTIGRSHRISTFGKSIIVDFKKEGVLKAKKL